MSNVHYTLTASLQLLVRELLAHLPLDQKKKIQELIDDVMRHAVSQDDQELISVLRAANRLLHNSALTDRVRRKTKIGFHHYEQEK